MAIKESQTDVLIVGAGPAGLMMATWLARCGVDYRIVDKRNAKIFNGQADGLSVRSLEIFDSFGFAYRAVHEACPMVEYALWNPGDDGKIQRNARLGLQDRGVCRFEPHVLHQGRIERYLMDTMAEDGGAAVERAVMPTKLEIDESKIDDMQAYPITVTLRHLTNEEATPKQVDASVKDGLYRSNLTPDDTAELLHASEIGDKANQEEVVKAKYVIGTDGAHSWVRNQLGVQLEGDSTDYVWGVVDIIPITDFPDIRTTCKIQSATAGSCLLIPRENKLVRLYIQLTTTEKLGEGESRADRSKISPELILEHARRIFAPYTMDYRVLDWWTAYQVGQRVATAFTASERVFLAGDAVHTHSPKAGQGMNVSLADAYNLGWKMASVLKGTCHPSILKTYQPERRAIAQELIDFDRRYSRLFSSKPSENKEVDGMSMDDTHLMIHQNKLLIYGFNVDYEASALVAKADHDKMHANGTTNGAAVQSPKNIGVVSDQSLAKGFPVGKRFHSEPVICQADAHVWHLQELLPSNGRWRVVVFAGDIRQGKQRKKLDAVGEALNAKTSFLHRYTPSGRAFDSIFEILLVHAGDRTEFNLFDFPEVFRHFDEKLGYDYWKIFADGESYLGPPCRTHEQFEISPEGCMVVVRPDQYVSYVGAMGDVGSIDAFFDGFMISPS